LSAGNKIHHQLYESMPGGLVVNYTPLDPDDIPDELRGTSFDRSPVRSFISDVQSLRQIADSVSLDDESLTVVLPTRSPTGRSRGGGGVRYDRNGRRVGPVSPSKVVLKPLEIADREHVAMRLAGIQDELEEKVRELEARVERDLSAERRRVRGREQNLERASLSVASGSAAAVGGQWVPPALNPADPASLYLKVYKANERLQSEFAGLQSHAEQLAEEAAALEARLRRKLGEERATTARLRTEASEAAVAHAESMEQARLDRLKSLEQLKREDEAHERLALEEEAARGVAALARAADEAAAVLGAAQAARAAERAALEGEMAELRKKLGVAEDGLVVAAKQANAAAAASAKALADQEAAGESALREAEAKRRQQLEETGGKASAELDRARADWQDERAAVARLTAQLKAAEGAATAARDKAAEAAGAAAAEEEKAAAQKEVELWKEKHDAMEAKSKNMEAELADVKAAAIDMMLEHENAQQEAATVPSFRPKSKEGIRADLERRSSSRPGTGSSEAAAAALAAVKEVDAPKAD
jgi:hypothetical protein